MELIINRVLYSLYCLENGIAAFFDNVVFKRFASGFCWLLYKFDPFGNIRSNYHTFSDYAEHTFLSAKEAAENEDYGLNINHSKGTLFVILFPFPLLVLSLFNIVLKLSVKPFPIAAASLVLSYFMCYLFSFKNDVYKKCFVKFRKGKNNKKWHAITLGVCCMSIIAFYISLRLIIKFWAFDR